MIYVKDMGYQFVNVGGFEADRPEGTGDYLFLFFRCPTEVCLKGRYELIPENTYIIYEKGAPQVYRKLDGHYINDWIHFDIVPYQNFFEDLDIPLNTPIRLKDTKEIEKLTSDMLLEYFTIREDREKILHHEARTLFHRFAQIYHESIGEDKIRIKHFPAFDKLRRHILNFEYQPQNGVEQIAEDMKMSRSYLQHLYKKFFGVSISNDLICARLEQARKLLDTTQYSISEIAEILQYDNIEHFSRQFKSKYGMSPRAYRDKQNISKKA